MRRVLFVLLVLVMLMVFSSGCALSEDETDGAMETIDQSQQVKEQQIEPYIKKSNGYRVGMSLQDDSPFVLRVGDKLAELVDAGDDSIELVVYNGMANPNAQIAHVESFISSGFDVIILDPISYDECAMAVTIAQNAGVPLITTIAQTYNPTGYMSFVGSDHYESGVIQAQMVADYLKGKGKVVVLEGVMGISAQIERHKGYIDVLKYYPNIEIVAIQTAAWQRDEAYAIVENWIRNGKDFSVVLSENDNMAMGALEAIEKHGKQGSFAVFGIDGDQDALLAVRDGRLKGTVFHNAEKIAETLYESILTLKTYKTIEQSYMIPFEPVTQENVDKYLHGY